MIMNTRPYLVISGIVFGLVTIFHAARVANGWMLGLGPWLIPMWVSWCGVLGPAILSVWALKLAVRSK
jgi:hypothetical protein